VTGSETLLIHLGGLGDVCISESAFLSLSRHFGKPSTAVGVKRVLEEFAAYFAGCASIDSRTWAYLFSPSLEGPRWQRIILFGKDRSGSLRQRLSLLCGELIFIDMYPDEERVPAEEYQLGQVGRYGATPVKAIFPRRPSDRIILYPEKGSTKRKWPVDRFLEVFARLKERGLNVLLLAPPGLALSVPHEEAPRDLREVAVCFSQGGVFFSNDSGMAHFAARCGLRPLTLFWDADPVVWSPRGSLVLACQKKAPTIEEVEDFITSGTEG